MLLYLLLLTFSSHFLIKIHATNLIYFILSFTLLVLTSNDSNFILSIPSFVLSSCLIKNYHISIDSYLSTLKINPFLP